MTKKRCPECYCPFWDNPEIPYLKCPHCGAKLNECSSEDADDGHFSEREDAENNA
jgi:uncharacterized Zn finger protein (UPF0148 family)